MIIHKTLLAGFKSQSTDPDPPKVNQPGSTFVISEDVGAALRSPGKSTKVASQGVFPMSEVTSTVEKLQHGSSEL